MPTFRSTIAQQVQWGVETTEGSAVAADKLISTIGVNFSEQATIDLFRAMGYNWPTIETLLDEYMGGALEGRPDYNALMYPLSGAISTPTTTTPAGGTTSRQHVFLLKAQGVDPYKTFTVERGDASFVDRIAGVALTDFNLHVSTDACELGGSIMGRKPDTTGTLTASPTSVAIRPMNPLQFAIYADDTSAGLGTTKLDAVFDANFAVSNRRSRVRVIDRALGSDAAATIQAEPDSDCGLQIAKNATSNALFTKMRTGTGKYIRLEAIGSVIETTITEKLWIDFFGLIGDSPSEDEAQGGVMADTWPFRIAADPAWVVGAVTGVAARITLVNSLATL